MNTHRARLLIRLAKDLRGADRDADREQLLSWADELLGEGTDPGSVDLVGLSQSPGDSLPRPVFKVYKHRRYEAELLPGWRMRWNGDLYRSPSAAAVAITKSNVNGWQFWRYTSNGESPVIDRLRSVRSRPTS